METKGSIKLLVALALAFALVGCNQSEREIIAQARQSTTTSEYRTSLIQLKNLLQNQPENGEAWLMLGRASLMLGSPADAETDLRKAEKYGVSKGEVAVPLARALLIQGESEKLLTELKPDVVRNTADRARLMILRGEAYLASDKPGQAKKSFDAALQIEPSATDATLGLAKVALANKDRARAEDLVQQVKQKKPKDPRAWLLTATMALTHGDYGKAEDAYKVALANAEPTLLPQESFMARARLAQAQIQDDKLQAALTNLKELNDASPDQPFSNYLRALVAYKLGHYEIAESRLQRVLKVSPDSISAQLLLGAVAYAQARYGQAEMHLSNVIGIAPNNVKARKLLALTLYKSGQQEQALQVLRPVAGDQYTDAQLLAMMSKAGSHPGPNAKVISDVPTPKNESQGLQFARHYIMTGKPQTAIALLEKMPEKAGAKTDYSREQLLIVALLRQGKIKDAMSKSQALVKAHPKDAQPHVLLGGTLRVAGKNDAAKAQFEQALKLDPDNELARLSLAQLAFDNKQYDTAADYYKEAIARQPKSARAMVGLARAEDAQGHADEALKWVKKARVVDPKAVTPRLLLVRYYTSRGEAKQALQIAQEAADIAPDSGIVMNALGIAQLNTGDKDAAIDSFKKAVENEPKSPGFRTNLARAEIADGQFGAAREELEKVVDTNPDYVPAVSLYALAQLQSGRLYEAIGLAKSLRDKYPATSYVLEGDLEVLDHQYDDAVKAYRSALKHRQTRALVAKEITAASAGRLSGADGAVLAWLKAHPDDAALRSALGDYYMSIDKNDKALAQYAKVIDKYPHNVAALNNMAWLYSLHHDAKAVEYAQQAHKLAPKAGEVTDTLGWALLQTGQPKKAVAILREAVKQTPKSPAVRYHLASALAQTGDKTEARELLAKVLASKNKFAARDAAEKLYSGLK
ncbi:MAG TPA: XrtA/PEP-CTERM system TPR-repeat protein PrsT [Gammaproteobacteria bacterium]|nr:XrtA/PEP-CTERM system TPR-repeat protein PrsT [Gammaproteobacteria bacterium]